MSGRLRQRCWAQGHRPATWSAAQRLGQVHGVQGVSVPRLLPTCSLDTSLTRDGIWEPSPPSEDTARAEATGIPASAALARACRRAQPSHRHLEPGAGWGGSGVSCEALMRQGLRGLAPACHPLQFLRTSHLPSVLSRRAPHTVVSRPG